MKFCVLLFFILFQFYTQAQSLLANGGFEEENICTEYKVNCAPEAWLTNDDVFFNYFKDPNRAHEGFHCMAFEAGHAVKTYKRTFIRSQLLCGLRKGNQYALEFFIKSQHRLLDSIGVYFTSYDFLFDKTQLQYVKPSFFLADAGIELRKDSSWQKVSFVYTADGSEAFITTGNFSKRDITGSTGIKMENNFFVFIDDVSLIPVNPKETICNDWEITKQKVYDQDERHEFLRRKIKEGKADPTEAIKLTINNILIVDTLVLPDILFETGKAVLQPESFLMLDSSCHKITASHVDSIIVEGHTDSTGNYDLNEKLSLERANSVKSYLQNKTGYHSIMARGLSFFKPIASNQTPQGRSKNRRVEILLYIRE